MSSVVALSIRTLTVICTVAVALGYYLEDYPFRNTSLDWDSRVDDLVSRLTLQVRHFADCFLMKLFRCLLCLLHTMFSLSGSIVVCLKFIVTYWSGPCGVEARRRWLTGFLWCFYARWVCKNHWQMLPRLWDVKPIHTLCGHLGCVNFCTTILLYAAHCNQ